MIQEHCFTWSDVVPFRGDARRVWVGLRHNIHPVAADLGAVWVPFVMSQGARVVPVFDIHFLTKQKQVNQAVVKKNKIK